MTRDGVTGTHSLLRPFSTQITPQLSLRHGMTAHGLLSGGEDRLRLLQQLSSRPCPMSLDGAHFSYLDGVVGENGKAVDVYSAACRNVEAASIRLLYMVIADKEGNKSKWLTLRYRAESRHDGPLSAWSPVSVA